MRRTGRVDPNAADTDSVILYYTILFWHCFQKTSSSWVLKVCTVGLMVNMAYEGKTIYLLYLTLNQSSQLTLKAPFMTIVAFVASVDQDQAAQNMQPDL